MISPGGVEGLAHFECEVPTYAEPVSMSDLKVEKL